MKMAFKKIKFGPDALELVQMSVGIIEDYEAQGYKLSLRQLYYQLVSKNAVVNTEASYKRVGDIIANARLAGLCDWDMIEDRNRECITPARWNNPGEIVDACARQYRIDKWKTQPHFCEVMVEKQALEGVLEPVCNELDIPFTSNKGYSSVTMMYHAGRKLREEFLKRVRAKMVSESHTTKIPARYLSDARGHGLAEWMTENRIVKEYLPMRLTKEAIADGWPRIVVFYLGDHDPSGIDMTRDVQERLQMFSDYTPIEVRRLALNMEQIEELQPPENPAKVTDSRARSYIERFGESSWELDAVAPDQLAQLVRDGVEELREERSWQDAVKKEKEQRGTLVKISSELNGHTITPPRKKK